jgi:predicted oxidoreductase
MTQIIQAYGARGGEVVNNTEVTKLKTEGGRVTGFEGVNTETGEAVDVTSKVVLLSTGGFNSNLDMVLKIRPDLKGDRILEGSGPNSDGAGHELVKGLGAHLSHMGNISFYVYATPDYRDPGQKRGLVCRDIPGYIWVNQQGKRFHNEARTGSRSASPAMMEQDPRHAWAILDRSMAANMTVADPQYRYAGEPIRGKIEELLDNSPFVKKSDTLEGLAGEMGVDEGTFMETVGAYNKACEERSETEPEFGKPLGASKMFDTPPYYGLQLFLLARKNLGGIKTDLRCRILGENLEPIPGLYGAGEVCGMAGGHINGRAGLEGTMFGPSIFSGRVAGGWAAQETGHGDGFVGKPNRG